MCKRRKCHFIYENLRVRLMSLSESTWLIYTFYIVCVKIFSPHPKGAFPFYLFNHKGSTVSF